MNKEKAYDEKVGPLMIQIIALCKEHKIAMLAQFATPNDEEPDLLCTTALLEKEFDPPEHMLRALGFLKRAGQPAPINMTIKGPKETTMVTILP